MGIDPTEIDKMEPIEEPDPKNHPLYKKVYKLSSDMHKWLEEKKPNQLAFEQMEILPADNEMITRFKESPEVIIWYNFFISAKIYRALTGIEEGEQDEGQSDSNGSAKIALITLDRLIASWSIVMENMMDHEDEILKFLISLVDIRKHTEAVFPLARKFVRPGFDQ